MSKKKMDRFKKKVKANSEKSFVTLTLPNTVGVGSSKPKKLTKKMLHERLDKMLEKLDGQRGIIATQGTRIHTLEMDVAELTARNNKSDNDAKLAGYQARLGKKYKIEDYYGGKYRVSFVSTWWTRFWLETMGNAEEFETECCLESWLKGKGL